MSFAREIWRLNIPLTRRCNLDCDYCYVKKENRELDPAIYQPALEKFLAGSGEAKDVVILGGEPLLFPDRLEKLIEQIRRLGRKNKKKVKISLCTNLSVNRINAPKGIDSIFVSLDGDRLAHDKNRLSEKPSRKGSFNRVFGNLKLLLGDKKLKDKIRITKVVSPDNAGSLFEDFVFLKKLKLPFNFSFAVGVSGWNKKILLSLEESFLKIFKELEADLKNNQGEIRENLAGFFTLPAVFCPFSNLSLGLDGKFYNCEFLALGAPGNHGFEIEKVSEKKCVYDLQENKCREETCLRCGLVCQKENLKSGRKLKPSAVEGLRRAQGYRNFLLTNFIKKHKVERPRQLVLLNYEDSLKHRVSNLVVWSGKFLPNFSGAGKIFSSAGGRGLKALGKKFNDVFVSDFKKLNFTKPVLFFDCRTQEVYFLRGGKKSREKISEEKEAWPLIKNNSIGNLRTGIKIIDFFL